MGKPIVLVIHGMGTHAPGEVKKQISAGLNEAAKNFGLENFKIEDKVEFFQFNYSEFLDELRNKDAEYAQTMAAHLKFLQGHGLGERLIKELTEFFADFDKDEMLYSHWMDVVYYGLTFFGEKIRVDLAKKINDIMIEANADSRKVHIVAHSLGTAVLHDTLAKMFRKDVDILSEIPTLDVDRFTINSVWTVANVSRLLNLLNDIADPNHSIVHSGPEGCCNYLYDVRNEFDPFTWPKTYNRNIENGKRIKVKTVRVKNTHDIKEYMAAPPVAKSFLFSVLGEMIPQNNYIAGIKKHAESSINLTYKELKEAFKDIKKSTNTVDERLALKAFFEAASDFKEKVENIWDEQTDDE
jgi:hypothetical protein